MAKVIDIASPMIESFTMSQEQIRMLVAQLTRIEDSFDEIRKDVSEMKTDLAVLRNDVNSLLEVDVAVLQNDVNSLLEDRRLVKGKVVVLITTISSILATVGTWLASKLGFPAP